MSPSFPSSKVLQPQTQRTSSTEPADAIRKRVCKACDRCRLKKSKCDGASPCSRCTADNAICVFGERKKSHDKIYPKGYVEMLEQQQGQLVHGLQEMYRRTLVANLWNGPPLAETAGRPLTHDILAALGLLEKQHNNSDELLAFEEDFDKLQARLLAQGAEYARRRGSVSSDSEHSNHARSSPSSHNTPVLSKPQLFRDTFSFDPSPTSSPAPGRRKPHPPAIQSPLHQNPPMTNTDPQLYRPDWTLPSDHQNPMATPLMTPSYPTMNAAQHFQQLQQQQRGIYDLRDLSKQDWADSPMTSDYDDLAGVSYPPLLDDFGEVDFAWPSAFDPAAMDVDFKSFIATA